MKKVTAILLCLLVLVATGCYDAPLSEKQNLPLDTSLFGTWEDTADGNKKFRVEISKHSETEYSIRLFGEDDISFLGYPIKVAGISCIQLSVADGKPATSASGKYYVVSFTVAGSNLIIKMLNHNLVSTDLKSSVELRKAFVQNKDNINLFSGMRRYKRINSTAKKQPTTGTELLNAAKEGDVITVKKLLAKGVNVNAKDSDGTTALIIATIMGKVLAVKTLLARGADVCIMDKNGLTALDWADSLNRTEIIKMLEKEMNKPCP